MNEEKLRYKCPGITDIWMCVCVFLDLEKIKKHKDLINLDMNDIKGGTYHLTV